MRHFWVVALGLSLLLGCGGATRHTVTPGTQGSLEGLSFYPQDHSRGVDTDTDPEIFWKQSYEPPSRFTVALKQIDEYGDYRPVSTELKQVEGTNRWKLKVVGTLNEGTLYAIIVRDDMRGEERESWFFTEKSRYRSEPRRKGQPPETFEHTVTLRPIIP